MLTRTQLLKLRKMSPRELQFRLTEKIRRMRERSARRGNSRASARWSNFSAEDFIASLHTLLPGATTAQLDASVAEFPGDCQRISQAYAARAEAIMAGQLILLGQQFNLTEGIHWDRDPIHDGSWGTGFYADLEHATPHENSDVKYIWELGRHQYLVDLAAAGRLGNRADYHLAAKKLLLEWIDANPQYCGIHWTSGLELAMRSISWMFTLAIQQPSGVWNETEILRVAVSLAEHAEYLKHHLSLYSSPFNHLIGEAAALLLIGRALSSHPRARAWRDLGRQLLSEFGPQQFYGDGFSVEQAVGYHFYTLGFLTLAIIAARRDHAPLDELEAIVKRAYEAGMALRQSNQQWPAIGDVDSARSIPTPSEKFWDFSSLYSLAAVTFVEPAFKINGSLPDAELFWLGGADALRRWSRIPAGEPQTNRWLPESGYAVAESPSGDWMLFDTGPMGAGLHGDATPSVSHGHADTLQVLYMIDGKECLFDPGMPFYNGLPEWTDHFRGAQSHNTLLIDGAPMAQQAGRLAWSNVAPAAKLHVNLSQHVWLAKASVEWHPAVQAQRFICGIPGIGILIADRVKSKEPRRMTLHWHVPTLEWTIERKNQQQQHRFSSRDFIVQIASLTEQHNVSLEQADKDSPVAWRSPGYGILERATRIRASIEPAMTNFVVTFIGKRLYDFEVIDRDSNRVGTMGKSAKGLTVEDGEIAWRLDTGDGQLLIVAGGQPPAAGNGHGNWTTLHGEGTWPAAMLRL